MFYEEQWKFPKWGAVLAYRYTGEFLLFSYPYMELWRSSLMFRSFVYWYTRTQPQMANSTSEKIIFFPYQVL